MSVAFTRLCDAVLPPSRPVEAGSVEAFAAVEAGLALALPDDYKRLVCAYGTGSWMDVLWVLNPFASNPHLNLAVQARRQLDAERTIRSDWPKLVPFALYPEPGGLFPWGLTDNGDRLYWLTAGDPGRWPTVAYESRGPSCWAASRRAAGCVSAHARMTCRPRVASTCKRSRREWRSRPHSPTSRRRGGGLRPFP